MTLLNPKIKVSKVQNLVPKVSIPGSKSLFFHLIFPLFKLVFMLLKYDTYNNGTVRTCFFTLESMFLTLLILKFVILKTDFGIFKLWFFTFENQTRNFTSIVMNLLNIQKPIEFICDKQNSTILLSELVPYLLQLESHHSHHFGVERKVIINIKKMFH